LWRRLQCSQQEPRKKILEKEAAHGTLSGGKMVRMKEERLHNHEPEK
jgi:hypothetical protein